MAKPLQDVAHYLPPARSGRRGTTVTADALSPSGQVIAREQCEAVQRALQQLPEDYRQVIVWRYQEGSSFEEIAQRLQRSENAARKLWFRALERLERELGGLAGSATTLLRGDKIWARSCPPPTR